MGFVFHYQGKPRLIRPKKGMKRLKELRQIREGSSYSLAAHTRRVQRLLAFWIVLFTSPSPLRAEIPLPTPLEHYDSFDPAAEGLRLFSSLFSELEPSQQSLVLQLMGGPMTERTAVV